VKKRKLIRLILAMALPVVLMNIFKGYLRYKNYKKIKDILTNILPTDSEPFLTKDEKSEIGCAYLEMEKQLKRMVKFKALNTHEKLSKVLELEEETFNRILGNEDVSYDELKNLLMVWDEWHREPIVYFV
jgi:hypothetical protein